jgi:histidyl-tRNA synthetase
VDQLDPKKLIEVVPNTDPETSARFSLPIPNWLKEDGSPRFDHPDIRLVDKKDRFEWRMHFTNFEDFCEQGVKIDGTGTIMIAGPTPGQSQIIINLVRERAPDLSALTPKHIHEILQITQEVMGLQDRYNDNISTLDRKMRAVGATQNHLGPFVYDDQRLPVSAAIYIQGSGYFRGPALESQHFENGAFVTFPGMSAKAAEKYIRAFDPRNSGEVLSKLVSKSVFLRSRRDKQNHAINIGAIPAQVEPVKHYKKIQPLGGFPELLPEFAAVQAGWIEKISNVYDSYGFVPIDIRHIEELSTLLGEGEDSDKEIFKAERVSKQHDSTKDRSLGLRFDLTVPTARYIAQNFSQLTFPFRRQQIGKVHRADDPNQGRYREFYQCDADVIGKGGLSIEYDAEMPRIMCDVVKAIGLDGVEIGINNRKIYQGFFEGAGLEGNDIIGSIRILDKLAKIGPEGVISRLSEEIGLNSVMIDKSLELASIKEYDGAFADRVMALGIDNDLIRQGVKELSTVMMRLEDMPKGFAVANLSIARGLDYYSGTVFEGHMKAFPEFPAILAGGRYDNLVSRFMAQRLPGVGISFGLTRVFNFLADKKLIMPGPSTPTQVLVTYNDGQDNEIKMAMQIRDRLRANGINAELFYGDRVSQMRYANEKHIPFVLFQTGEKDRPYEIKDMKTSQQRVISLHDWKPQ